VAGQPAGEFQELAEQYLAVAREVGEIDAAFGAANRSDQGNRQDVQQFMALGVAVRGSGRFANRDQTDAILVPPTVEGTDKNPRNPALSRGKIPYAIRVGRFLGEPLERHSVWRMTVSR
jgi:hypothetical protein